MGRVEMSKTTIKAGLKSPEILKPAEIAEFLRFYREQSAQSTFLKKLDVLQLKRAVRAGDAQILMIRNHQGEVVAACVLRKITNRGHLQSFAEYRINLEGGKAAIIGSLMVSGEYQGCGLAGQLINEAKEICKGEGISQAFAKVNNENKASACSFLKGGFERVAQGHYPHNPRAAFTIYCAKIQMGFEEETMAGNVDAVGTSGIAAPLELALAA